jgi:branched-chain amino acid aminotransferase
MHIPVLPEKFFFEGLNKLVSIDKDWIPKELGSSIYIRPFIFSSSTMLAASPSLDYKFLIICSPGGAYYSKSLSVYVEDKFSRAAPGGAGYAKAAGNYGASFYPISLAVSKGFDQIVWTDSLTHQKIEEVGTMSIMFRIKDKLITPKTSDTILDGVSRKTVIQIARDLGIDVEERDITINELISEHRNGDLKEIFGCGTAVVISKISSFGYKEDKFELEEIKENYADRLKESIINIQQNVSEDLHGWRYKILD